MARNSDISFSVSQNLNISFDNFTIENILEAIKNASIEGIDDSITVDWNILQKQANLFLSNLLLLEKQKVVITAKELKNQLLANPYAANILNNQKINKDRLLLQSEYMLAFKFDEYLNAFRENNKEKKAIYVETKKGQISGSFEISLRELVLTASKTGRLDISNKNLSRENIQALEETKGYFEEDHLIEALSAYNGVTTRLNRFYETHGGQRQGGLLMWKESDKWKVGTVLNSGDLKEAYISFLFDKHQNDVCVLAGGEPPFYSHEFISSFFRKYINKVTNLAAIVEEDVVTNNKEFAVKGVGAKLPSLQQYVITAAWIINQKNIITKVDIENFIDKEFRSKEVFRNIEKDLSEITEEEVLKILNDMQKTFS